MGLALGGEDLIVLDVHLVIQLQRGLDLLDRRWLCLEEVVHIESALNLVRGVGKVLAAETVDLLELAALSFDRFAHTADHLVDALFFTDGIEDDDAFVFPFHIGSCSCESRPS